MQQDPIGIQTTVHEAPNGAEVDIVMLFDYAASETAILAMLFRQHPIENNKHDSFRLEPL